jgi:hypothetical protein
VKRRGRRAAPEMGRRGANGWALRDQGGPPTRRSGHQRRGVAAPTTGEEEEVVVVVSSRSVRIRSSRRWRVGVGRPLRSGG